MNTSNKLSISESKKRLSIKSMYFNRFLIFRYVTAGFFFTNLYWLILLTRSDYYWIVPGSLLLVDLVITVEQTSKYWYPNNKLLVTKIGYAIQILSNIILLLAINLGKSKQLYPFIKQGHMDVIIYILLTGIIISIFLQYRAWLIEHNRDRYLTRYLDFKKASLEGN